MAQALQSVLKYYFKKFGWVSILLLSSVAVYSQTPVWQSVVAAEQTTGFSAGTEIATDASGNVYLAGVFTGTVTFGNTVLTSSNPANQDIYVAKWSPVTNGFVWAQRAGGTGGDFVGGIAVIGNSIYITGCFNSLAAQFGSHTLATTGSSADYDVYVAKLTDAGSSSSFTWAQRAGGSDSDLATSMAVSGNNIYITGQFRGASVAFGSSVLSSSGNSDSFVAKVADDGLTGRFVWAQQSGGSSNDSGYALAANGVSIYVAGNFQATAGFGSNSLTSSGASDIYVAKLLDAGSSASFIWARQAGGNGGDLTSALACTATSVYVAGSFSSTVAVFGNATLTHSGGVLGDAFVAKLTDTGSSASFEWAQSAGGAGEDAAAGLAVSGTNVYVTGYFASTTASFGSTVLSNAGTSSDIFIAKLMDDGSTSRYVWAQRAGGAKADSGSELAVVGNRIYLCGSTNPPANFGPLAVSNPATTQVPFIASLNDANSLSATKQAVGFNFSIAPNPATTYTTLHLPAVEGVVVAGLTLVDATGRVVFARTIKLATTSTTVGLSLNGLLPGIYHLRVQAGHAQAGRTMVVK